MQRRTRGLGSGRWVGGFLSQIEIRGVSCSILLQQWAWIHRQAWTRSDQVRQPQKCACAVVYWPGGVPHRLVRGMGNVPAKHMDSRHGPRLPKQSAKAPPPPKSGRVSGGLQEIDASKRHSRLFVVVAGHGPNQAWREKLGPFRQGQLRPAQALARACLAVVGHCKPRLGPERCLVPAPGSRGQERACRAKRWVETGMSARRQLCGLLLSVLVAWRGLVLVPRCLACFFCPGSPGFPLLSKAKKPRVSLVHPIPCPPCPSIVPQSIPCRVLTDTGPGPPPEKLRPAPVSVPIAPPPLSKHNGLGSIQLWPLVS